MRKSHNNNDLNQPLFEVEMGVAMEPSEHRRAGDEIIMQPDISHYVKCSDQLDGVLTVDKRRVRFPTQKLETTMMYLLDGVPVPIKNGEDPVILTSGEIIALAGDFYTSAGWGYDLNLNANSANANENEQAAFQRAFGDLASPQLKRTEIKEIFKIVDDRNLKGKLAELAYIATVPDYLKKLEGNVAHFAPWSDRAYEVGHESALKMACLSYEFKELAKQPKANAVAATEPLREISDLIKTIMANKSKYFFRNDQTEQKIYIELAARYHALAVSQDLFAMHFYSDHFAPGHLSRMGSLRIDIPNHFKLAPWSLWHLNPLWALKHVFVDIIPNWIASKLGSMLVNAMHNEDNTLGLPTTNPHAAGTTMYQDRVISLGDGAFDNASNDDSANLLFGGMSSSLADIARASITGKIPNSSKEYGGRPFLLDIDYSKILPAPLCVKMADRKIYVRRNVHSAPGLSSDDYKLLLNNPSSNLLYQPLTKWRNFTLFMQCHVFKTVPLETPDYVPNAKPDSTNVMVQSLGSRGNPLDQKPSPVSERIYNATVSTTLVEEQKQSDLRASTRLSV